MFFSLKFTVKQFCFISCKRKPKIMDKWIGKVAIVTGASSGIGYAVVEKLVTEGMMVSNGMNNMTLHQESVIGTYNSYKSKISQ